MLSLRGQLQKLGPTGASFRYSDFTLRPRSLRAALRSMDEPGQFAAVPVPADREHDTQWAQEAQGIAFTGTHWIISTNGSDLGTALPKALYSFAASTGFADGDVVSRLDLDDRSVPGVPGGIFHVGSCCWHDGLLWVDHFGPGGAHILRFRVDGRGQASYLDHLPLRHRVHQRVGLVAIDRWTGGFITGRTEVLEPGHLPPGVRSGPSARAALRTPRPPQRLVGDELFLHDAEGLDTGRGIRLDPPIVDGGYLQGGAFSDNGHLYIASGRAGRRPRQYIYGYHLLTGRRFATIEVITEEANQELEGVSFVRVDWNGYPVRLAAVLLENEWAEHDDAYLKAFTAERPDDV